MAEGGESTTDPSPQGADLRVCSAQTSNSFGEFTSWARLAFDAKGRWRFKATGNTASPATTSEYGYDSFGRLVSAPPSTFAYVEGMLNRKIGDRVVDSWTLDAHDRVINVSSNDGAGVWGVQATYAHDDAGRLMQYDSPGRNRRYDYDDLGFLAHDILLQPDGPGMCRRTWVWTHGDTEVVSVEDDSGTVTQRCSYGFDELDRLTSANCGTSRATWLYDAGAITVSLANASKFTKAYRFEGDCDLPLSRATFARAFQPEDPDPRPIRHSMAQVLLFTEPMPKPYLDCTNGSGFE